MKKELISMYSKMSKIYKYVLFPAKSLIIN